MFCCRHLEQQYFVVLLPERKNRPHRERLHCATLSSLQAAQIWSMVLMESHGLPLGYKHPITSHNFAATSRDQNLLNSCTSFALVFSGFNPSSVAFTSNNHSKMLGALCPSGNLGNPVFIRP